MLRWEDVDLVRRTATLPTTKSGRSMRPLSHLAHDVLRGLVHAGKLVFPSTRGDGAMTGFRKLWDRVMKLGNLPADITPHVLRHSFASLAADLGYSEVTIAALIGHRGQSITSRYIHSADAVLPAAANAVANETARRMDNAPHGGKAVSLQAGKDAAAMPANSKASTIKDRPSALRGAAVTATVIGRWPNIWDRSGRRSVGPR
jgi:hypothetical protein